jgi:putative intracellular protease/amidase
VEKINAGIFIFDGVEVLDFAGPFEVFSRTRLVPVPSRAAPRTARPSRSSPIAATREPVRATGGLRVRARITTSPPRPAWTSS